MVDFAQTIVQTSIRDIATRAGVSSGTVSHVLNGNVSARISLATQERVQQAARELGYQPNHVARSLRRQRTNTIGVLLGGLRNPFFVGVYEELQLAARAEGFELRLEATPSVHGTFGGYETPTGYWPVDGVLMWALSDTTLEQVFGSSMMHLPKIYLGDVRTDVPDYVACDHEAGGRLAAQRLLSQGYTKIGVVTPYAFGLDRHEDQRHKGFRETLASAGVVSRSYLTDADETREAGRMLGERIASLSPTERPEALFCHNDILAIGVCCGLRRAGLRPGREVAVIGFDGIEEGLYAEQPLTTIVLPVQKMCQEAIRCLAASVRRDAPTTSSVLPPTLREGGTG
jgi:DNA-binding LacI/PurR family transcriptional regulator